MSVRICTTITAPVFDEFLSKIQKIQQHHDLLELRVDTIRDFTHQDVSILRRSVHVPAIFTCRKKSEGGFFAGTEDERYAMLQEALDHEFPYVDIELSSIERHSFVKNPRSKYIVSYHNFDKTPAYWDIQSIMSTMHSYGADIIKIATTVQTEQDIQILYKTIINKNLHEERIVIGMGEKGIITRIIGPLIGSYLTYAAFDTPTAPGQLTYKMLTSLYRDLLAVTG